uniref:Secreted protein n=1 Tax=Ixodes ricinus TaxID=34613 RepID=A0A6B0TT36_IXORI
MASLWPLICVVFSMLLSFAMKSGLSQPAMLTFEFHDALLYGAKYRHIFFLVFFFAFAAARNRVLRNLQLFRIP